MLESTSSTADEDPSKSAFIMPWTNRPRHSTLADHDPASEGAKGQHTTKSLSATRSSKVPFEQKWLEQNSFPLVSSRFYSFPLVFSLFPVVSCFPSFSPYFLPVFLFIPVPIFPFSVDALYGRAIIGVLPQLAMFCTISGPVAMEAYLPSKPLFGRAPSQLAFALPSDRRSIISHRISTEFWVSYLFNLMLLSTSWFCSSNGNGFSNAAIFRSSLCFNLSLLSLLFVNMFVHCLPLLNDRCQTFGSTSSMLCHGLQQLLHALTHDTMSGDSHQSRQPAPNIIVHSGISHYRSFKMCPHFHRTARRHRSSIQIRVHVSRVLDHRSERLTKNAAYTNVPSICSTWTNSVGPCRMPVALQDLSTPATTQVLNLERRIRRLNDWLLSQLRTMIGILATRSSLVASIGTPAFNVNPFPCRDRLRWNRKTISYS